jgi:acid phosphatase type 7
MARRTLPRWLVWLLAIGLVGCSFWVSAADAADPVIAASGDISCGSNSTGATCHQAQTANVLASISGLSAVLPLGDVQYECGELSNFNSFYDPTWGRFKSITHPAVGNHEYLVAGPGTDCLGQGPGAPGYFTYFGSSIASPLDPGCTSSCQGYYSYNLGTWHLIALNSNCSQPGVGGCDAGSPQYNWLKNDLSLAGGMENCILAYWHQPRYSSGGRQGSQTQPLWELLYDAGTDVVLTGHDHVYERFAKLGRGTPAAVDPVADPNGIREWVVGLGGRNVTSWSTIRAESEVRDNSAFGVLKLTLHANGYDWQFLPEAGKTFTDAGSDACNGSPVVGTIPPPGPPTSPPPQPSTSPPPQPSTSSPTGHPHANGRPQIESASISGLARGMPAIGVKLVAGQHAPKLSAFKIKLPRGLSFVRHRVHGRLKVTGVSVNGAKVKSLVLRGGRLGVTLRRPVRSLIVKVGAKALRESAALKRDARRHHLKRLMLTVVITDAAGRSTTVTRQLKSS